MAISDEEIARLYSQQQGFIRYIAFMRPRRNYVVLGLILGLALGIATRKLIIGLCIGLILGTMLNRLQDRPPRS